MSRLNAILEELEATSAKGMVVGRISPHGSANADVAEANAKELRDNPKFYATNPGTKTMGIGEGDVDLMIKNGATDGGGFPMHDPPQDDEERSFEFPEGIKLGQRWRDKTSTTTAKVKSIDDQDIVLVTEQGVDPDGVTRVGEMSFHMTPSSLRGGWELIPR